MEIYLFKMGIAMLGFALVLFLGLRFIERMARKDVFDLIKEDLK